MKKRLWVLHPLLLASTLPALAAQSDEDSIIVSANRIAPWRNGPNHWVIEGREMSSRSGREEFKDVLAQLIPGIDVSSGADQLWDEHARARNRRAD